MRGWIPACSSFGLTLHKDASWREEDITLCSSKLISPAARDEYRCHLESLLQDHTFNPDLHPEESWDTMKSCIVSAAEETVGRGKRMQPEWFKNVEILMPLIEMKNKAHSRMLLVNSAASQKEFRQKQGMVKNAVDRARERWIRKVAMEEKVKQL